LRICVFFRQCELLDMSGRASTMKFVNAALDFLECQSVWRYSPDTAPAAEPTAWTAIALAAYDRHSGAQRAREWLAGAQNVDGSVGIRRDEPVPGWPTALAVLAWNVKFPRSDTAATRDASRRAVQWLLASAGEISAGSEFLQHDTNIPGWPWVLGTHSWVEPTALGLLALRSVGLESHARAIDAARLLDDRLLESGGCNYGNTVVLGQALLPHVEPTGLALLALGGEPDPHGRIAAAIEYLESALGPDTAPASLAYGVLGLAAHSRVLPDTDQWLTSGFSRAYQRKSSLELALLALAALKQDCPLISHVTVPQPV
jgi:hypothetical protein